MLSQLTAQNPLYKLQRPQKVLRRRREAGDAPQSTNLRLLKLLQTRLHFPTSTLSHLVTTIQVTSSSSPQTLLLCQREAAAGRPRRNVGTNKLPPNPQFPSSAPKT